MNNQHMKTSIVFVFSLIFMCLLGPSEVYAENASSKIKEKKAGLADQEAQDRIQSGEQQTLQSVQKKAGLILQGSKLKAMRGYVLERAPNNQISARLVGGGPLGGTATCGCSGAGNCDMSTSGDIAVCAKSPGKPCHGKCEWGLGISTSGGVKMH